jgi:hypothetical protein
MALCSFCEAETQLFVNGFPLCPHCADAKPTNRQIKDRLERDLADATLAAESAFTEFQAVTAHIPSGIPHPDGTQRIHNASRRMKVARDDLITAHWRLNNFIEHGIVPEDLKRSG